MRFPSLPFRREDGPIRIPLPAVVRVGFGVYIRPHGHTPPEKENLQRVVRRWLEEHARDPLRGAMMDYLTRGWLAIESGTREMLPSPPLEILRHLGAGELEERRFEEATHLVVLSAPDAVAGPKIGFWSALAGARAIAAAASGVILDPEIPRLLPVESHSDPVPEDGRISLREQIVVPHSVDRRGLGWMTTKGMSKFGLPEIEIRDVPPNLADSLGPIINGTARLIAQAVLEQGHGREEPPKELEIGPELRLRLEDLFPRDEAGETPEPPEGARGWTLVRLEYRPSRGRGASAFLSLVPPAGFRGDHGVWLNSLLTDLVGSENTLRHVKADSEAMEAAHHRALAGLPAVKERFQAGLRPGETLHVKHGFPCADGGHEYMWIAVSTWDGDRIRGRLANTPQLRPDLRAGQEVEIGEDEVFDWLLRRADGEMEGGYTIRVVEREGERDADIE